QDTALAAVRFEVKTIEPEAAGAGSDNISGEVTLEITTGGVAFTGAFKPGFHVVQFVNNTTSTPSFEFENTGTGEIAIDNVAVLRNGYLEVGHPWDGEDECRKLTYAQSNDVLFFGHPLYRPYVLKRYTESWWSLEEYPFEN